MTPILPENSAHEPKTVSKTIAKELLAVQKAIVYFILIGMAVTVFCLILFKPFKFDSEKYKKVEGVKTYNTLNSTVYSPYWWSEGFFEYCDGEVGFNAYFPQMSYAERKKYLIWKAIRFGLYAVLVCGGLFLVYRYGSRGQRWLIQNAK